MGEAPGAARRSSRRGRRWRRGPCGARRGRPRGTGAWRRWHLAWPAPSRRSGGGSRRRRCGPRAAGPSRDRRRPGGRRRGGPARGGREPRWPASRGGRRRPAAPGIHPPRPGEVGDHRGHPAPAGGPGEQVQGVADVGAGGPRGAGPVGRGGGRQRVEERTGVGGSGTRGEGGDPLGREHMGPDPVTGPGREQGERPGRADDEVALGAAGGPEVGRGGEVDHQPRLDLPLGDRRPGRGGPALGR